MDFLEQIDQQLFLFLNGLHNPFWDEIMYWISYKFTWVPLYLAVLIYLIVKQKRYAVISIILLVLAIVLADQMSVNLFKNVFLRYRPCHNLDIQPLVHLVNNHCGGQYGFVSSHATNSFAFAILSALIINKKNFSIFFALWALLVSYSRIYLGVHYPADIIGGGLLGTAIAFGLFYINKKLKLKLTH